MSFRETGTVRICFWGGLEPYILELSGDRYGWDLLFGGSEPYVFEILADRYG